MIAFALGDMVLFELGPETAIGLAKTSSSFKTMSDTAEEAVTQHHVLNMHHCCSVPMTWKMQGRTNLWDAARDVQCQACIGTGSQGPQDLLCS